MENKYMSYINDIPENLKIALYHGKEEVYLEYKGNVAWSDRVKMLEIVETIFALSNERGGGIIVVGAKDDGTREGLDDNNYNSYSHDQINQYLTGRGNQPIQCKVEKFEHLDTKDKKVKKFVFIQVSESKEFPLVYIGNQELKNQSIQAFNNNISLRTGALYIRNKSNIGNKEISTIHEWQELIERTYKKFEKETLRRYSIIKGKGVNPFDKELKI
ncbi:putative DNA binding domain-containing protein [Candidatus Parcubacteria bacterium]|nr:putative DNA binding domain-containing protein [Candidatus Parcubacteria bacterium]